MNWRHCRMSGLIAVAAWLAVIAGPGCQSMFHSSLCELATGEQLATQSSVRFPATLYAGADGSLILNDPACPPTGKAWARVQFHSSLPTDPDVAALLKGAQHLGSLTAWRAAPVIVAGTLKDNGNACFGPRFDLEVAEIDIVGAETTVTSAMLSDMLATTPSNYRMQRSARSEIALLPLTPLRAPADACRSAASVFGGCPCLREWR